MKVVQVGILIALLAVGALLFMVWRGQQQMAVAPATPETPPAAAAVTPPPEAPQAAPAQPAAKSIEKPSPAARPKRPSQPAAAETKSEPAATAQEAPVAATAPAAEPAPPAPPVQVASDVRPEAPPPPPPPPRTVTVAAGTLLSARLTETLSSDRVQPGDTFTATLDRPLVVDGLVLAERGARVDGRVVEAQQAGRVKGVSSLAVKLVRLHTSDGQRVEIQTDTFHKAGETTKREDATKVGVGAGLGAVIGAIAGGGKGAAIGTAVGGAAGAGTVAATRGKPTVLPVETRIDFRLSSPVTLTEKK